MPEEKKDPKFVSGEEIEALLDRLSQERIPPDAKVQCKVCWYVYDPAEGCPQESIDPGTPFADLPDSFVCPDCGHPKTSFIPVEE